jgi:hypothetical protein
MATKPTVVKTPPPPLGYSNPQVAADVAILTRLRDLLSLGAIATIIVLAIFTIIMAATKTSDAGCAYGVTRFFEVAVDGKAANAKGAKQVGGLSQAVRALQSSMNLPFHDVATFGDEVKDGQWWVSREVLRRMLDTNDGGLRGAGMILVDEPETNTTRLILRGQDPCDEQLYTTLEPSVNVDKDSFVIHHRDWRQCVGAAPQLLQGPQNPELIVWDFTTVRIDSRKRIALKTVADVGRRYPAVKTKLPDLRLPLAVVKKAYVSTFALYDGEIAVQLHVTCSDKGSPFDNPDIIESIYATFDVPPRSENRELDDAMRKVSHRAQDLLGRGIHIDGSVAMRTVSLALLVR